MKTVRHINDITNAILVFVPMLLTMRAVKDGIDAYDADAGLRQALQKIKKRVIAAIIAIGISSIIGFIRAYYA